MRSRYWRVRRVAWGWVSLLIMVGAVARVQAWFLPPEPCPVDRLVKSAEAYLAKHPNQSTAHYTLARVHYLAFHVRRNYAPVLDFDARDGALPLPAPQWMVGLINYNDPDNPVPMEPLSNQQVLGHAACAARSFAEALRLRPENGLCLLGQASFCEEFVLWKQSAKPGELPKVLQEITLEKARDAYAKAFALAIAMDSQMGSRPLNGLHTIVSYEAGRALMRLAQGREQSLSDLEKGDLKLAQDAVAKFQSLPMGGVTPIVFALQPVGHLTDLLAPYRIVDFDLRGWGFHEQWTWVKPELGILVWDPQKTGHITSARQLFGGYTFQIFRDTGYDALAALDDNGDGVLSGKELEGIRVWFDRNGDGKSTPDEVVSLRELGVSSIAITATAQDGIHPMNPRGVTFADGRVLPSWDWMAEPVRVQTGLTGLTGLK